MTNNTKMNKKLIIKPLPMLTLTGIIVAEKYHNKGTTRTFIVILGKLTLNYNHQITPQTTKNFLDANMIGMTKSQAIKLYEVFAILFHVILLPTHTYGAV